MKKQSIAGLSVATILFVVLLCIPAPDSMNPKAWQMIAVTALVAVLWVSDAVYYGVTALLPIILLPIFGITSAADVTKSYANESIYLFMGGFMIALAMERCDLHRRFALSTLKLIGTSPSRLVLGFMVVVYLLSMWVNNTATVLMMMPVCAALTAKIGQAGSGNKQAESFSKALMLGVAYSASIGGVATLIGTPPNIIFASMMSQTLSVDISFFRWMLFATPVSLVMLVAAWFLLTRIIYPMRRSPIAVDREFIVAESKSLGPMNSSERRTLIVFATVAVLWIVRGVIDIPLFHKISDTTIAVAGAVALFLIPSGGGRGMLLDWKTATKLPWGVLILFGGGLALSRGFTDSGLSEWITEVVSHIGSVNVWIPVLAVTTLVVFLTEIMSNTATATLLIPVMISVATALGFDPLIIVVPVTMAASFAFMLPVSTPPNAIVFSYGHLRIGEMIKAGFVLNLLAIVILTVASVLYLPVVLH